MSDAAATPVIIRPARRLRFGIGMLLLLIACVAPVAALVVRDGASDVTMAAATILVMTGLAVGTARRARAWQIAAQVGLAAGVVLLLFDVWDDMNRLFYAIVVLFAATVVAPLMIRNALGSIGEAKRGAVKAASDLAWNVGLNLAAALAFTYVVEDYLPPLFQMTVRSAPPALPSATMVSVPTFGPTIRDEVDAEAMPALLDPWPGPFPRACEVPDERLPSPDLAPSAL